MTTPYGTTTFRQEAGDPALPDADLRRIEATDPLGATERLEFHRTSTLLPAQAPANEVPAGFAVANDYLYWYNTFYWDKQAMAVAPGALESAVITNWLQGTAQAYGHAQSRHVPHSVKRPLESRVWYRYPDQPASHHAMGSGTSPALTGRVMEGGVSQVTAARHARKQDWMFYRGIAITMLASAASGLAAIFLSVPLGVAREVAVQVVMAAAFVLVIGTAAMIWHVIYRFGGSDAARTALLWQALWLGPFAAIPYLWSADTGRLRPMGTRSRWWLMGGESVFLLAWVWWTSRVIRDLDLRETSDVARAVALPVVGAAIITLILRLALQTPPRLVALLLLPSVLLLVVVNQHRPWWGLAVAATAAGCATVVVYLTRSFRFR